MNPMFLHDVESNPDPKSAYIPLIEQLKAMGAPISQIFYLFAFKPDRTKYLEGFTQGVMRGPSPLSPGMRELIAAFTSAQNHCPF
ncbi:MAG: peroxidase [Terriglobia bacterium]